MEIAFDTREDLIEKLGVYLAWADGYYSWRDPVGSVRCV